MRQFGFGVFLLLASSAAFAQSGDIPARYLEYDTSAIVYLDLGADVAETEAAPSARRAAYRFPAEPEVRVLVVEGAGEVEVSAPGGLHIVGDGPPRIWPSPEALIVRPAGRASGTAGGGSGVVEVAAPSETEPVVLDASVFFSIEPAGETMLLDGRPYRGRLVFLPRRSLSVVNVVRLEDYLRGVVPLEIGPLSETTFAAVSAQAIAARTYAIRNLGKHANEGFDLYGDVRDQVYGGASAERPLSDRAVEATAGKIVTYEGVPARTFYHSTCGGKTASPGEVGWDADEPYLVSQEDLLGESHACLASKWYRWRVVQTRSDVDEVFRRAGLAGAAKQIDLQNVSPSSRIRRVHLVDADGAETWIEGTLAVRRALGAADQPLPSAAFSVTRVGEQLVFEGRGAGHGVGMCQMGAVGRAIAGWDAEAILSFYYPGTEVVEAYEVEGQPVEPAAAPLVAVPPVAVPPVAEPAKPVPEEAVEIPPSGEDETETGAYPAIRFRRPTEEEERRWREEGVVWGDAAE